MFPGCIWCCQTAWKVQQDSDPKSLLPGLKSDQERASETLIQKRELRDTHLEIVKNARASSRIEAREEKTSCLPQSANLLSALAQQKCWFTWESYCYIHETIPLQEERVKRWKGAMSLNHTKISHTSVFLKNCSSKLSIFFWHQTISKILLLYREGWNETLVNSVQTFPMKDKTSDKSIGLQARRQALMEMFFIAWKGCIIAVCLLLGCWESDTVLPLRCEDHSVNVYEAHRHI